MSESRTMPIATLGPAGTDALAVAESLGKPIIVCDSFPAAMQLAMQGDAVALICAGYREIDDDGNLVDDWTRLHFRSISKMKLVFSWSQPTKPMCLAVNTDLVAEGGEPRSIALHPATSVLAEQAFPHALLQRFHAKPLAVEAAARGYADACVGSADVVALYPNLCSIQTYEAEMVWCLYERRV